MQLLEVECGDSSLTYHYEGGVTRRVKRKKPKAPAVERSSNPSMDTSCALEMEESWRLEQARRAKAEYKSSRKQEVHQGASQYEMDDDLWVLSMLELSDPEGAKQMRAEMKGTKPQVLSRIQSKRPEALPSSEQEKEDDAWCDEMLELAGSGAKGGE